MRVVILAPIDNSPFSRSVAALCQAEPGVEIAGIVIRKILNPARLRSEFRRDGVRLVRKIWKKLVLESDDGVASDEPGFDSVAQEAGGGKIRLSTFAKHHNIPCVKVDDHNDERSLTALSRMRPDVVAFTGGGIIRKPLLEASGQGIFNIHMGMLPMYRGMDVVEWPILEKRTESPGLGVTLHFMDLGIDTGPVAFRRRIPIRADDSIERLRKRFEPAMVDLMLEGIRAVRDEQLPLDSQVDGEGRQCFIMHPRFYDEVRRSLERIVGSLT
jgi:folate-dependent phosphoribosylglycinamide formyltransferase PurN